MLSQVIKFSLVLILSTGFLGGGPKTVKQLTETPKTYTVVIDQMKYNPAKITVHRGDTIVFINKDIVAHDVTEKNKKWASPRLEPGDSWKMTATESANYFCSIHVVMKGEIIVK